MLLAACGATASHRAYLTSVADVTGTPARSLRRPGTRSLGRFPVAADQAARMDRVPDPYFPLRDRLTWVYAVSGPVIQKIFKVRVEPQVEVAVEDLVTHDVRSEQAWVLREDDAPELTYAI